MLFYSFSRGGEIRISTHVLSTGGIFSETGGGDFVANLSFYIILANAVKISVWVICLEIEAKNGVFLLNCFCSCMLLHH